MKTDLPPEAFTKETLQKAFNWLQEQPEAVRASVHTPARLVSLFQKSQRLSDGDAPVSSKKFIDDLKTLATSLDQFGSREKPTVKPQPPEKMQQKIIEPSPWGSPPSSKSEAPAQSQASKPVESPSLEKEKSKSEDPPPASRPQQEVSPMKAEDHRPTASASTPSPVVERPESKLQPKMASLTLDALTIERVSVVKQRFNLSSDSEALRLLVSFGFEKFSQIQ